MDGSISVLALIKYHETQHSFKLPFTSAIADLRNTFTHICGKSNLCFHLSDTNQLLCDADLLLDFADQQSTSPACLLTECTQNNCQEISEEFIQKFERSHELVYPPEQRVIRIGASEGTTVFVRTSGCVYSFHCLPHDKLGDLRDVCARTFCLEPVQVTLRSASKGTLFPLCQDGDPLHELQNASVLDVEAREGSIRIFFALSDTCVSHQDIPAITPLSSIRNFATSLVDGLATARFRVWSLGEELKEGDKRTVGQRLIGRHPVYIELESEVECLMLPKGSIAERFNELCGVPLLDMSSSLNLWLENEAGTRIAIEGLFSESRLEHLLRQVMGLVGQQETDPLLSINVDGKCYAQKPLHATLQQLDIKGGDIIRAESPFQLHVDFGNQESMKITIPCRCITVLELRKMIEKESGMPLCQVRLLTSKKFPMPDGISISECGICCNDHILCQRAHRLRVWWQDRVYSFFASPEMELLEVVSFLEEKTCIAKVSLVLTELSTGRVFLPTNMRMTVREAGLSHDSELSVSELQSKKAGTWLLNDAPTDASCFPSFMTSTASDDEYFDDDDNFDSDDE